MALYNYAYYYYIIINTIFLSFDNGLLFRGHPVGQTT